MIFARPTAAMPCSRKSRDAASRIRSRVVSLCSGAYRIGSPPSAGEELQDLWDELAVKLEDAAVPGVGVDLELAVGQALGEVDRIRRWHHAVVIAVRNE